MDKHLQKPKILKVETVARSRLFNVESVDLEFSNGVRRVYERMRPSDREAVMIVPVIGDDLLLIREYAVGTESYELGFPKGLIDPGEGAGGRQPRADGRGGIRREALRFSQQADDGALLLFQQNEYRAGARSLSAEHGRG